MSEVLGRLQKNTAEELRIVLEVFRPGHEYLDIRIWKSVEAGRPGAEIQTERGFLLDVERLPEFIALLTRIERDLKARKESGR
jgi:hypothetical protein